MLFFSTKLPIKENVTKAMCFDLFKDWIINSKHYKFENIAYDVNLFEDFDCIEDNASFSIRNYKDEQIEILACRLEHKDKDAIWDTDCVYLKDESSKYILVQLNCNSINYISKLPRGHKPYIIKKLVESEYCSADDEIEVSSCPIIINDSTIDLCIKVMNGTSNNTMPVVYISRDKNGNLAIDSEKLAKELSGLAHVFIEGNREVSFNLKDRTNRNNAHNGYIGIYFPKTFYWQKYVIEEYKNSKDMYNHLVDSVWKALANKIDFSMYNWNQIISLQNKQKMLKWKDIGESHKEELKNYIETFDKENKDLIDKNHKLNEDLFQARSQIAALKERINNKKDKCFYNCGEEKPLYDSELNDLLYSILSQVKNNYTSQSRAYILIEDLLKHNPKVGECEKVMETLKRILNNLTKLTKTDINNLKKCGFKVEEDGPHYKLIFHDERYIFMVSKTPSDYREGNNLYSDISKIIDIEKNFANK